MENAITIYNESNEAEKGITESQFSMLMQEIQRIGSDVKYLRNIVQAKQEKLEAKRERKRQELLSQQKKEQAERNRRIYENLVDKLKDRPWQFMPYPKGPFSPKETEMVGLFANGNSDFQIAQKMGIKESSIPARLCVICKRLNLKERSELIEQFKKYTKNWKRHRRRRTRIILSWLLNPPPGHFEHSNINAGWRRKLGKSSSYRHAGPYITDEVFIYTNPHELLAWKFKMKGMRDEDIAAKMKIRKSTLQSYLSEVRTTIRIIAGVDLRSTEDLVKHYKEHPMFRGIAKTKNIRLSD